MMATHPALVEGSFDFVFPQAMTTVQ
jgi:hypothetical protein